MLLLAHPISLENYPVRWRFLELKLINAFSSLRLIVMKGLEKNGFALKLILLIHTSKILCAKMLRRTNYLKHISTRIFIQGDKSSYGNRRRKVRKIPELCQHYLNGSCQLGDKCNYMHDILFKLSFLLNIASLAYIFEAFKLILK